MLEGRFGNTTGRPYIEGRLHFPRLNLTTDISFLVDTGADASIMNPGDVLRTGLEVESLRGRSESVGLGGAIQSFVEHVWVIFTDSDDAVHIYRLDMAIAPVPVDTSIRAGAMDIPSLLGRDILDRWRMVYDPESRVLEFEVRSADLTIPAE